ncbi:hypothetical protein HPP92_022826 [Vanilla planifolia]|uniref:2Fe-2S ferredoxin-type domain-containing protein n=1 Tax=Vanilla planifolia TaxID=51239 RepID=A0A835UFS6_VANPL|nr:hypothetical protein HPP92_022826 [Vanilla planifolia]
MFLHLLPRLRLRIAQWPMPGSQFLGGRSYFGAALRQYLHQMGNHSFSTTATNKEHEGGGEQNREKISVTFVGKDGEEKPYVFQLECRCWKLLMKNDIELEGACEGSLACSTCHVIVMDVGYYNKLEDPTDEENDMLDLAFALTETSRLGCQVIIKPELDGMRFWHCQLLHGILLLMDMYQNLTNWMF